LIRRLLQAIPTFLGITLLTFFIVYSAPGDPVLQVTFDPSISGATREELRERLGLDQPLAVQYVNWLVGNGWQNNAHVAPRKGILFGDFGDSLIEHRPVLEMIGERLGATLLLTGTATLIGYLVGVPIGVYAAVRQGHIQLCAQLLARPCGDPVPRRQIPPVGPACYSVRRHVYTDSRH
jgi:peptide/nickel transport system permease protein